MMYNYVYGVLSLYNFVMLQSLTSSEIQLNTICTKCFGCETDFSQKLLLSLLDKYLYDFVAAGPLL